jgi:hypothetical protein
VCLTSSTTVDYEPHSSNRAFDITLSFFTQSVFFRTGPYSYFYTKTLPTDCSLFITDSIFYPSQPLISTYPPLISPSLISSPPFFSSFTSLNLLFWPLNHNPLWSAFGPEDCLHSNEHKGKQWRPIYCRVSLVSPLLLSPQTIHRTPVDIQWWEYKRRTNEKQIYWQWSCYLALFVQYIRSSIKTMNASTITMRNIPSNKLSIVHVVIQYPIVSIYPRDTY